MRLRWIDYQLIARSLLDKFNFGEGTVGRMAAAIVPAALFFAGILGLALAVDMPTEVALGVGGMAMLTVLGAAGAMVTGTADNNLRREQAAAAAAYETAQALADAKKRTADRAADAERSKSAKRLADAEERKAEATRAAARRKVACPYCGEPIRQGVAKCRHCHEILDLDLADERREPEPLAYNPGIAAVLSFLIPGLGQLYKTQVLTGLAWFGVVQTLYAVGLLGTMVCLIGLPVLMLAVVMHLFCIVGAASTR